MHVSPPLKHQIVDPSPQTRPKTKEAPAWGASGFHAAGARIPIFSSLGISSWPRKGSSVT